MTDKIRAILVVEIAGRPAEYVKESLKNHILQMKNDKTISIISMCISDPKEIQTKENKNTGMFTCFAEVEVEVNNMQKLTDLIFDYMPSSVEVVDGETAFSLPEATSFLNSLSGRLHKYDEIAKIAQFQNQELAKRLQEHMQKEKPEKKSKKKKK